MQPSTPWPMGHAPSGLQVQRWVVGVDTSLSMQGFVQGGGMQQLLDSTRLAIQKAQTPQASLQAHAIESKGLVPWSTGQQDAQTFLASLNTAPQRFNAPNNDLISALRALGQQVAGQPNLALVLTDLIPSVKTDGSDATGVGLALAEWIKGGGDKARGACLVRFDLPFAGKYYPEKPKATPFPLKGIRPIYLIILGPTPSASSTFAHALQKNWQEIGGNPEAIGIADLTPDLSQRLQVTHDGSQRTPGFEVKEVPMGIAAIRLGAKRDWKVQVSAEIEAILPGATTASVTPIEEGDGWKSKGSALSVLPSKKAPGRWTFAYKARTNIRKQAKQEAFRVTWKAAEPTPLPNWVNDYSAHGDTPAEVLPTGAKRIRTLNLLPILNAARSGAPQPATASTYVFVTKAK